MKNPIQMIKQCVEKEETKQSTEIQNVVLQLIKLSVGSKEYYKCLEKLRWLETGGHTLGLNSSLEPAATSKSIIEFNIKKAF